MPSATRNRRRASPPKPVYRFPAPPIALGGDRFRLHAHSLQKGKPDTPLGDLATDIAWQDAGSEMTGTVNLTDPTNRLKLTQGQRLSLEWAPGERDPFRELWTMLIDAPTVTRAASSHSLSMATGVNQANKGTQSYSFRKSKSHPRGWTCDEVARHVGRQSAIPLGKLARGSHRITKLVQTSAKPLDIIIKAYRAERVATGRLFFIYWDGRLNIVPLRPSADLLLFAGALIDASYQEKLPSNFATAITVRGTTKPRERVDRKGKRHKVRRTQRKLFVSVSSHAGIRRYGYVHRDVTAPDAQTRAQAKKFGENLLRTAIKPERTLTVTVPFRPTLRRGDAFKINWQSQGLTQVCFVAALSHSVAGGSLQTEITCQFTDPFEDELAKRAEEARKAKAKQRGRTDTTRTGAKGGQTSRSRRRAG